MCSRGWALEEEALGNGMLTYHAMEFVEDAQRGEISAVFELGGVVTQLSKVFHFFFRDAHRAHCQRGISAKNSSFKGLRGFTEHQFIPCRID